MPGQEIPTGTPFAMQPRGSPKSFPNPSCRGRRGARPRSPRQPSSRSPPQLRGAARGCIFKPELINFGSSSPSPAPSPLSKCQRRREAVRVMYELGFGCRCWRVIYCAASSLAARMGSVWLGGRPLPRSQNKLPTSLPSPLIPGSVSAPAGALRLPPLPSATGLA